MRVVPPRQHRFVQSVEIGHGREDPFRVQARELPRFGGRRIGADRPGQAPQASQKSLGAQNPAAKGVAKRRRRRICQARLHEADIGGTCISPPLIALPRRQERVVRHPCRRASSVAIARIARPLPLLRTPHQASTHRVEVNITAHGPIIAFVLDHLGAVPPLEQVALAPPPPPRPDRVAREEALHAHAQVGTGCLHQQMEVISHHDVTNQLPAIADDRLLEQSISRRRSASSRTIFCRALPRAIT